MSSSRDEGEVNSPVTKKAEAWVSVEITLVASHFFALFSTQHHFSNILHFVLQHGLYIGAEHADRVVVGVFNIPSVANWVEVLCETSHEAAGAGC